MDIQTFIEKNNIKTNVSYIGQSGYGEMFRCEIVAQDGESMSFVYFSGEVGASITPYKIISTAFIRHKTVKDESVFANEEDLRISNELLRLFDVEIFNVDI